MQPLSLPAGSSVKVCKLEEVEGLCKLGWEVIGTLKCEEIEYGQEQVLVQPDLTYGAWAGQTPTPGTWVGQTTTLMKPLKVEVTKFVLTFNAGSQVANLQKELAESREQTATVKADLEVARSELTRATQDNQTLDAYIRRLENEFRDVNQRLQIAETTIQARHLERARFEKALGIEAFSKILRGEEPASHVEGSLESDVPDRFTRVGGEQ